MPQMDVADLVNDVHGRSSETNTSALPKNIGATKKAAAKPKKPKFVIKFDVDQDWKKLLANSRAATTLAASTVNAAADNLLPDDLQYNATSLTKLFLLPSRNGKTLTRRYGDGDGDDDAVDMDGDDWTNADTFGDDAYIPSSPGEGGADDNFGDSPIPLFDDASGDEGDDMMPASAATGPPAAGDLKLIDNVRQVQKINIGYAQKPKIMDVKKLKETLWGEIEDNTIRNENGENEGGNSNGNDAAMAKPDAAQPDTHTFQQMIAGRSLSLVRARALSWRVTGDMARLLFPLAC